MIGRAAELLTLTEALDGLGPGGRVVVVEGAAGLGKTTLMTELEEHARARSVRVLRCIGVERQMSGGFGALHELLHPVLTAAEALPARQRAALLTALGSGDGTVSDPLLVGLAALGVFEELTATGRPLLVVVEDLHWLDPSSSAVVDFVSRRLTQAPVLLVATLRPQSRPGPALTAPEVTRVSLAPLSEPESAELVRQLAPDLTERARRRVVDEAGGNPLALNEFSLVLADTLADTRQGDSLPARLATSRRLENAFTGDLAGLPAASRRLLLVAAAGDETTSLPELLAAAAALGVTPADAEPLERNRLISVQRDRLTFSHSLVRSAVYGAASSSERAAAHRELAGVTLDPVRAAWHRASALMERDEAVAAELVAAAELARRRAALPEAASALRRAADLSPDPDDRVHRMALAAEMTRQAGQAEECAAMLAEAIPQARRAEDAVMLAVTENLLGLTTGLPIRSVDDVLALSGSLAAPTVQEVLFQRNTLLAAVAGRVDALGADPDVRARVRDAVADLLAVDDSWPQQVVMAWADPVAAAPRIRPQLPALFELLSGFAMAGGQERIPGGNQYLHVFGRVAEALHDLTAARRSWEQYYLFHQQQGGAAEVATALQGRATARLMTGDLIGARADGEQGIELGTVSRSPRSAAAAAAVAALACAFLGDTGRATELIRYADETSDHQPHALITSRARWAAGLVAMAEGRHSDAWFELLEVAAHPTTAMWAVADLAEAGTRSGHLTAARELVAEAARRAEAFDAPIVWAVVHRAQAMLGDGPGAEDHHRRSIEQAEAAGAGLERARSELAYGEWLRRQRRIAEAREYLGSALRGFQRLSAEALVQRAAGELRAAGGASVTQRMPVPDAEASLTPQERQIVQLAATGLSNREIADQLFLSHRTVGVHLYKAYPKLGVSNRAQLVDLLHLAAG
ncbi:LuxR family transcriptional regulator [Actinoplanes sp. M2I2]|uniref:ATP-binding protein n=1 Tax=Actinoplanes sp. M2I2 TaxID=1734444 RepID=UPI0020217057|nr:LuxR family transcriptional regulator [Actinoplanes sp. M2I2]